MSNSDPVTSEQQAEDAHEGARAQFWRALFGDEPTDPVSWDEQNAALGVLLATVEAELAVAIEVCERANAVERVEIVAKEHIERWRAVLSASREEAARGEAT